MVISTSGNFLFYIEHICWLFDNILTKYAVALSLGAIVAIQDVHQHMYVTVESVDNKYKVGGKVHYSLAGKKALFRVRVPLLCF